MSKYKIQKWEDFHKDSLGKKNDYFDLFFKHIKNKAIKYLTKNNIKNKKLLEIGCGNGQMLNIFKKAGFITVGIDVNYIVLNESAINDNLVCGNIQQLPFIANSFDSIYSFSVLQYCNHDNVLSECKRVLSQHGKLVLIENMGKNPFAIFYRYIHKKKGWSYPAFQTPMKYIEWENRKRIKKFFPNASFTPFHLTTPLLMYVFRILPNTRIIYCSLKVIYYILEFIDTIVLKLFPFLSKYCWRVMICA